MKTRIFHSLALGLLSGAALASAAAALADEAFPSPSGQAYRVHYGSETASSLTISFGVGDTSGPVTITDVGASTPEPPTGNLQFGTLGTWSQADDGSVTISGTLYFLPNAGAGPDSVTCERWDNSYAGAEETCWYDPQGIGYGPLLPD
ncbi:hypothetical protein [Maricaulis sp.]|uniref:hypothetical protein n=1 Tax=Maricaulis sp. TaxID=1486257 RepID=UPI0025B95BA1|nr:hypothetical protein [Maricaulis sp.]